ncbi:MAG TPA: ADP-forming succinate--CoA ligase subunit beta [Euzebyales bacterium]|nr:ADP-forming succinate--CoA ligase subunit beta [Euzebyales bacterium]
MEYQGKELFRELGIPTTPRGEVAETPADAESHAANFGVPVMVKAQVLTGGRGKAGGVKYCSDPDEARSRASEILGLDISGHTVEKVLVEPASDLAEEYYLSVLYDRTSKGYKVIASVEGGVEIEEVNRTHPEKVLKEDIDPTVGLDLERARDIITRAQFPDEVVDDAAALLVKLYEGFVASDATLFEVNPLVKTTDGRVIALDSKVSIDGNALFRHEDLAAQAEGGADDPLEAKARQQGLQYVKLDGTVGVLGNGAGLVMSTLDVVNQAGGAPANFLDVGGGADAEKMTASLSLVLSDPQVRSVLVNIFGGITRCDEIANGMLAALQNLGDIPQKLVVRLDGTNAAEGRRILDEADHPSIVTADTMVAGAEKAVQLAAAQGAAT